MLEHERYCCPMCGSSCYNYNTGECYACNPVVINKPPKKKMKENMRTTGRLEGAFVMMIAISLYLIARYGL